MVGGAGIEPDLNLGSWLRGQVTLLLTTSL